MIKILVICTHLFLLQIVAVVPPVTVLVYQVEVKRVMVQIEIGMILEIIEIEIILLLLLLATIEIIIILLLQEVQEIIVISQEILETTEEMIEIVVGDSVPSH